MNGIPFVRRVRAAACCAAMVLLGSAAWGHGGPAPPADAVLKAFTTAGSSATTLATTPVRTVTAPDDGLPAAKGAAATTLGCLIEASATVEVGSSVIGVLESMAVERGDVVRRGQVLAQLDAQVERAAVMLAQAKLSNQADIASARAQKSYAIKKAERTAELTQLNFVSGQARDQADTEASMADMKLAQTMEQQTLAKNELQLARAQLGQRIIISPLDGVVVDRMASPGERIENRPILKLAQIDPLRVEVVLPAAQFGRIQRGMKASVQPALPGRGAQTATVTIVDRVIDAASNTFRARLALPNSDLSLPSGVRCKVDFAL